MRTTLDIDDDVLTAAKEIAAGQKTTAGKVISDLVRRALTHPAERAEMALEDGWYVLPRRGGLVTNELVDRLAEEADLADAGLDKSK